MTSVKAKLKYLKGYVKNAPTEHKEMIEDVISRYENKTINILKQH